MQDSTCQSVEFLQLISECVITAATVRGPECPGSWAEL